MPEKVGIMLGIAGKKSLTWKKMAGHRNWKTNVARAQRASQNATGDWSGGELL